MHSASGGLTAGLPHSEIPGSMLGYQLLWAYRRFLRPSSSLDAKTSTVCPLANRTNPTPRSLATGWQTRTRDDSRAPRNSPRPSVFHPLRGFRRIASMNPEGFHRRSYSMLAFFVLTSPSAAESAGNPASSPTRRIVSFVSIRLSKSSDSTGINPIFAPPQSRRPQPLRFRGGRTLGIDPPESSPSRLVF